MKTGMKQTETKTTGSILTGIKNGRAVVVAIFPTPEAAHKAAKKLSGTYTGMMVTELELSK